MIYIYIIKYKIYELKQNIIFNCIAEIIILHNCRFLLILLIQGKDINVPRLSTIIKRKKGKIAKDAGFNEIVSGKF